MTRNNSAQSGSEPANISQKFWNNQVRRENLRSGSRDNVRKIVEEEGKTARNLVAWSVPSEKGSDRDSIKSGFKPLSEFKTNKSQKSSNKQRGRPKSKKQTGNSTSLILSETTKKNSTDESQQSDIRHKIEAEGSRVTKSIEYQERIRKAIETGAENLARRERPSSAASILSQKNLRARYWSYLFDNFHRAVDEIYLTCENDESVVECEEVIMMLDSCKRDFRELINRLELFNKIETSQIKPQALAWEVRKQMSPGKCPSPGLRRSPSPAAARFLNFPSPTKATFSWADRVRGVTVGNMFNDCKELSVNTAAEHEQQLKSGYPSPVLEMSTEEVVKEDFAPKNVHGDDMRKNGGDDDSEGWEIVTKGRSKSKTSTMSLSSSSSTKSSNRQTVIAHIELPLKSLSSQRSLNSAVINSQSYDKVTTKQDDTPPLTSTVQNFNKETYKKLEDLKLESIQSADSFADTTLDFSYDFTDDEIQLQIKEEQEMALASAIAEEENLTKELEQEALKDDDQEEDISSDRDYTNTDDGRDTPKDLSEELPLDTSMDEPGKSLTWEEMCRQYDNEHDTGSYNWGELMDLSDSVRIPGRALEMHQKLSSPSRKKSRSESVRRSEEKMARVERRRLRLLEEKCQRLKDLSERVQKVRELKNRLIHEKERSMVEQMKRAEVNRKIVLQEKIKRAQEEEMKVNEIAFINTLEAQNKKIEVQEKHQVSEARLQDLLEERQRRKEDKHAKEEAAQERRNALERERIARLQEIKQKRGYQAAKWAKERVEREKKREEQAKERQQEREMKVAARNEALQHAAEELQRRIEQKHIESTKRHEQRIEEVKEKSRAASSSRHSTVEETPSAVPYEKLKKCTLCDVEISSDVYMVSHLKGQKHKTAVKETNKKVTEAELEAFSSKYIKDAEINSSTKQKEIDDRLKAMKKKLKKLKTRMANKGKEYESNLQSNEKLFDSPKKGRLQKLIKDINKSLQAHCNGPWPTNKVASLDKILCEIIRVLDGKNIADQKIFSELGGLAVLARVLLLWDLSNMEKSQKHMIVPAKIIKHASEAIQAACCGCFENCRYFLLSNKLGVLIDLLTCRLMFVNENAKQMDVKQQALCDTFPTKDTNEELVKALLTTVQQDDGLVFTLISTISMILKAFYPKSLIRQEKEVVPVDMFQRVTDLISYIVCSGLLDYCKRLYEHIQGPLEDVTLANVVKRIIEFYQPLAFSITRLDSIFTSRKEDMFLISQLIQQTEAIGLVSLMYSLLHQGSSTRISPSPLPLADSTVYILTTTLKTLNAFAMLDLAVFQNTVACEGISLQYRSVISYLIRYTSCNEKCEELLHEVLLSIGFFTVFNHENQITIQAGRAPSLLQQLCTLPFGYFSDSRLKNILFPTLIATCYNNNENKELIAQDVNPTLLAIFLEEKMKEKLDYSISDAIDDRSHLEFRLPRKKWEEVKQYFGDSDA